MSYPLTPTFYRLPDQYAGPTIENLLSAVYYSLTSPFDYRENNLPSTHLWTWATGSTSGSLSSIYNTSIPSGSDMTQNPTIIIAGFSGSATPTMISGDAYTQNCLLIGVNKNGSTYTDWTNSLPMTTGSFTGYYLLTAAAARTTSTVVRSYVSQDSIFLQIIQAAGTQYWGFGGAIIEPHVPYVSSSLACESDDRIYGVGSNGTTAVPTNFLTTNAGPFFNRVKCFFPNSSSTATLGKRNNINTAITWVQNDIMDNYIYDRIRMVTGSGGSYLATSSFGSMSGMFNGNVTSLNKSELRSGSVDLYHFIVADLSAGTSYITLKAAP